MGKVGKNGQTKQPLHSINNHIRKSSAENLLLRSKKSLTPERTLYNNKSGGSPVVSAVPAVATAEKPVYKSSVNAIANFALGTSGGVESDVNSGTVGVQVSRTFPPQNNYLTN